MNKCGDEETLLTDCPGQGPGAGIAACTVTGCSENCPRCCCGRVPSGGRAALVGLVGGLHSGAESAAAAAVVA